jgi:hypothetical protein
MKEVRDLKDALSAPDGLLWCVNTGFLMMSTMMGMVAT